MNSHTGEYSSVEKNHQNGLSERWIFFRWIRNQYNGLAQRWIFFNWNVSSKWNRRDVYILQVKKSSLLWTRTQVNILQVNKNLYNGHSLSWIVFRWKYHSDRCILLAQWWIFSSWKHYSLWILWSKSSFTLFGTVSHSFVSFASFWSHSYHRLCCGPFYHIWPILNPFHPDWHSLVLFSLFGSFD